MKDAGVGGQSLPDGERTVCGRDERPSRRNRKQRLQTKLAVPLDKAGRS
jgi:hypothetical protein